MTGRLLRVIALATLLSAVVLLALTVPPALRLARGDGVLGTLQVVSSDCAPGVLCVQRGTFVSADETVALEDVQVAGAPRPTGEVVWLGGGDVVFPAHSWSPLIVALAALAACLLGTQRLAVAPVKRAASRSGAPRRRDL